MESFQQNPEVRFGWYIRPSYEMSRAQAEMHDLLKRQFGLIAGGALMPHATVKGFFRSDAPVADIISAFDSAVEGHTPFPVINNGPVPFGRGGVALNIHQMEDGSINQPLQSLHESAWKAITPLVHPDCNFTPNEGSMDRFRAHLTLAMADIAEGFFDEILAFINDARPIGPDRFQAEYFHLFAFSSDAWNGNWWETLGWKLLHGWKLGEETAPANHANERG